MPIWINLRWVLHLLFMKTIHNFKVFGRCKFLGLCHTYFCHLEGKDAEKSRCVRACKGLNFIQSSGAILWVDKELSVAWRNKAKVHKKSCILCSWVPTAKPASIIFRWFFFLHLFLNYVFWIYNDLNWAVNTTLRYSVPDNCFNQ